MATINQNVTMWAGDDLILAGTCTQVDGVTPQNLSGITLSWALAAAPTQQPLVEKSMGSGIAITNAVAGTFTVTIADADTANLGEGRYYHEARLTDGSGLQRVIMSGYISLRPSITAP